jgi:hypothetical protein
VDPDQRVTLEVHPALALLWDPDNRWKIVRNAGRTTAVVSDGLRSGVRYRYQLPLCAVWEQRPLVGQSMSKLRQPTRALGLTPSRF